MTPYLTRSWHVVRLAFGPGLDDPNSPLLPAVLWVRRGGSGDCVDQPQAPQVTEPAWLVTPALLASLAWRVDSSNKTAPPGSPEALGRLQRWFGVCDALRDELERMRAGLADWYDRYSLAGGPPPLPTPPDLAGLVIRRVGGMEVVTPWDGGQGVEVEVINLRANEGCAMVVSPMAATPVRRSRRRAKR